MREVEEGDCSRPHRPVQAARLSCRVTCTASGRQGTELEVGLDLVRERVG